MPGTWGTSRHASPCSGPFSQTAPVPTLGGLPSPVLPTIGISRVVTPSAASWHLATADPTASGAPQVHSVPCTQSPLIEALSLCPAPASCAHLLPTEGQAASCRHLTELRNITKGACYLDQVEVSYCSGHCPSSISVMPEVSEGAAVQVQESQVSLHP